MPCFPSLAADPAGDIECSTRNFRLNPPPKKKDLGSFLVSTGGGGDAAPKLRQLEGATLFHANPLPLLFLDSKSAEDGRVSNTLSITQIKEFQVGFCMELFNGVSQLGSALPPKIISLAGKKLHQFDFRLFLGHRAKAGWLLFGKAVTRNKNQGEGTDIGSPFTFVAGLSDFRTTRPRERSLHTLCDGRASLCTGHQAALPTPCLSPKRA